MGNMTDELTCICGKKAKRVEDLEYKGLLLKGWRCDCGEAMIDPYYANLYLKYVKLKKKGKVKAKVRKVGNSLVLTIPSTVRDLLEIKKGSEVNLKLTKDGFNVKV